MEFWFKFNNGAEQLQLPVNPEEISIESGSQNTSVNVAGLGEISIIQDPVLLTFEFSSFLPKVWGPYCAYRNLPSPWVVRNTIERWRRSGIPVRFIITRTPINYAATIDDFSVSERAGEDGLNFSLTLKEYRMIKPRKLSPDHAGYGELTTGDDSNRPGDQSSPSSYTVKAGDSLWKIAQSQLGDGTRYKEIAALNGIKAPYTIQIGKVLYLPK
ncbi:LysM peptidoglycan-binding domain-containing protein [Paenibacillus daejeonensis]|uniref:LysM peptidoglycan-binding domain-containing protein n=1 Tax=Paenibacillus daejeonensis TaxID=135193 RepID=UPI0003671D08|nr:LysM peptidoglycan-binding domain-containing protein [Paenibacillus daejeonensis]